MKQAIVVLILFSILALLFILGRNPVTQVRAQGEEPTKAPYVFPTPIFIPTFPADAATTSAQAATNTPAATSAPAGTRAPDAGDRTYTIVSGDSPWIIAQKMYNDGTKYKLILDANNLTTNSKLKVGSTLTIPALAGAPRPPAPTATQSAPVAVAPAVAATSAPTIAPTVAPKITVAPVVTATAVITTTIATTRTSTTLIPSSITFAIIAGTNVLSVIAFIGSLISAVMALLLFERTRRFSAVDSRKGRLTRWMRK